MDHMEKYWTEELECIRKGVNKIDGYVTTISPHYLRDRLGNEAYPDRVFGELDIVWAITHGKIVEGFDSGEKGRNPQRVYFTVRCLNSSLKSCRCSPNINTPASLN